MKKNLLKNIALTAVIGIMSFSFAGCSKASNGGESKEASTKEVVATTIDKIKESKKLVIGTSADYPPYEFHKEIDGKDTIIGFDVDIAQEIAKDLGVELEINDMKFDGLIAALKTGKVDMVLAGMNPTDERKQSVDFSKIYYTAEQAVIVRAEDKDKYKSLADLKGKEVGVQKGSIQEGLATEQIEGATVKGLGKVTDLVLELKNKKVDAIIVEVPVAKFYAEKNTDLVITDCKFAIEEGEQGSAIAIQKGDEAFVEAVNKTLDRLIKEGKIEEFVVKANEQVE
ncbi:ABC transporter substrate-binding protein [Clostridium sp.]|uniref:ABC transporter substrate-binding protein n=1 Tax=Clostridium sp. TaxID=1506 RepID=UPI002FC8C439